MFSSERCGERLELVGNLGRRAKTCILYIFVSKVWMFEKCVNNLGTVLMWRTWKQKRSACPTILTVIIFRVARKNRTKVDLCINLDSL